MMLGDELMLVKCIMSYLKQTDQQNKNKKSRWLASQYKVAATEY